MRATWLIVAGAAAIAAPAVADTKAGVDAWQRGDYRTAVDEWRRGAARGDADAQYNLAQAYKLGRGVPIDTQQAQELYRKAAAQGHVEAENAYGLALFQNGRTREAVPYLEKAAGRGDPRARYLLGTMLFNGIDVRKDWPRAYALTTLARQDGLPQAAGSLQQMDGYLSAADKQAGLALAAQMRPAGTGGLPDAVAAAGDADVPPSLAGGPRRGPSPPPPVVAGRAPPPSPTARTAPPASPRAAPVAARPPAPAPAITGRWRLQLGAFGDAGNARRLGGQLAGRFPGRTVSYAKAGALTRVLVGPFASAGAAQAACGSLRPCVPVAP